MATYDYGGSDEENAEIRRLVLELDVDSDNFELWETLIIACENLDGGLSRNSRPEALDTMRNTFDRVLLKFPLLFGYWKKYADFEFNIAGSEAAEMVYERGCASITNSVDLWTQYCAFKMDTTHESQPVRDLFERAAQHVGLDFLAHPFWDKYIEFEERMEAPERVFAILKQIIHIPMHQYARYSERYQLLSATRPSSDIVDESVLAHLRAEADSGSSDAEIEVLIRPKIDALSYAIFTKTQEEVTKRWTFEAEIKRPYFHVTQLEHAQLANWRKYLDFEEAEGDYTRTVFLYERCLVTCALYDEFWFRYARWMSGQPDKEADVRNIYLRASTLFVPISRPGIRLQFAFFEESCGRVDIARAIHHAILNLLPNSVEVILSLGNLERRQAGLEGAIAFYKKTLGEPRISLFTKAAVVAEWAYMLWKTKGSPAEARTVFSKNAQYYEDSMHFWYKWLDFELAQPIAPAGPKEARKEKESKKDAKDAKDAKKADAAQDHAQHVITELQSRGRLPLAVKKELCGVYMAYLQRVGGKDSMKKYLAIDREVFGPASVASTALQSSGAEMDKDTLEQATIRYTSFYESFAEPDPEALGTADFN